ncbi:MAG: extracellular solute-binding protein [Clostridia bacterium]|nr:extracellular solute-binding protein [Clostridia bacterium]
MKKRISFALAILMLAGIFALVSCGNENTPENTGTGTVFVDVSENTEPEYTFPVAYFNNEPFVVYNRVSADYGAEYIISDEVNGDIVSDAVFTRNTMVEEKYGIRIETKDDSHPSNHVRQDVSSGSVDYDILLDIKTHLASLTVNSVLADFNDLGLDFNKPWWDRHFVTDLSIGGRVYLMQCDVSIARFTNIRFFYYNKGLINDYHLDNPISFYDNDDWTLENFLTMVKGVSSPAADGSLGTYGIVLEEGAANSVYMHMLTGIGIRYTDVDQDGLFTEIITDQVDKMDTFNSIVSAVFNDKNYALTMDEAVELNGTNPVSGNHKYDQARSLWAQGHFLFTQSSIAATNQFREMKDDYGIMPNPKYNKDQKEYAHKCDKYALCFAIPFHDSVDMERLATVMDYWAYVSRDTVIPNYYDITILSRRFSDPRSSDIMNKIIETVRYEFCDVFGLNQLPDVIYDGFIENNFSSKWASIKKLLDSELRKVNEKYK